MQFSSLLRVSCRLSLMIVLSLPLAAQSNTQSTTPTPPDTMKDEATSQSLASDKNKKTTAPLELGVGDLVEMTVYNVPELSTKTRVSSNGDMVEAATPDCAALDALLWPTQHRPTQAVISTTAANRIPHSS